MATWTQLANTSIQRSSQTLAVVSGHAFIYGGELRPREPVDSAMHRISIDHGNSHCSSWQVLSTKRTVSDKPDPKITTLQPPNNAPSPRVGTASTTLNNKIYIFSGRGGTAMAPIEEAGSFWVFDPFTSSGPSSGSWSQVHPTDDRPHPIGRSYHALTNNGKDTIFLHAGCPETGRLRDLWAFNIHARTWCELPSAPGPARGGPSIAYAQGKLFRVNGFDGNTEQGGAVDVFTPEGEIRSGKGTWETVAYAADGVSGPVPRSVGCLVPVVAKGGICLVTMFGEHDPSNLGHLGAGKMLTDVWVFDIRGQRWDEVRVDVGDKPVARGWFAADVVPGPGPGPGPGSGSGSGSGVIVHGGLAESNERLGDAWRLDFR